MNLHAHCFILCVVLLVGTSLGIKSSFIVMMNALGYLITTVLNLGIRLYHNGKIRSVDQMITILTHISFPPRLQMGLPTLCRSGPTNHILLLHGRHWLYSTYTDTCKIIQWRHIESWYLYRTPDDYDRIFDSRIHRKMHQISGFRNI